MDTNSREYYYQDILNSAINNTDVVYHRTTTGSEIIHRALIPASDWTRFATNHGLPAIDLIP